LPINEAKRLKQFCFKIKDSTLEGVYSMNQYAKSTTRFTRIVTSVVISLTLFASSVPMSTYAAIQAPPLESNIVTQTMQHVFRFFFPRPLYVGTLMNGSSDAGMPDRGDEKATMATSNWTNLVVNLETGNHLVTADIMSVPTASGLPMSVQLVHNSFNASIDVGVGKGWMRA
jgi:hypothetical protein